MDDALQTLDRIEFKINFSRLGFNFTRRLVEYVHRKYSLLKHRVVFA